jgi:hypothetical protein
MKYALGLFLLLPTFSSHAQGTLQLRARVPPSLTLTWAEGEGRGAARLHSNHAHSRHQNSKVKVVRKKNRVLVSIIHP